MNHEMRVFPENFEKIRLGQKCREYRLYDEKRRKIMPEDTITFYNTETKILPLCDDFFELFE